MPVSHHEGKAWTAERVQRLSPLSVVDVGAGEGIYAMTMRELTPPECKWTAVEAFEPYVERFKLESKYDEVIIGDITKMLLPIADLYIFGDVIEHMTAIGGMNVLEEARALGDAVVVSLPLVHMEQGAVNGNEYERHNSFWTFAEVKNVLRPTDTYLGEVIGVAWWER